MSAPASFLSPPDGAGVVYEFFAPFVHIPGKYEACRIRSPTHGVFDCFIVLGPTTSDAATVYVNSAQGSAFMSQRYPECTTIRVQARGLRLGERRGGLSVAAALDATQGPVRKARLTFAAKAGIPTAVPYGGEGTPVWGSRFTCWGVDLVLKGQATGSIMAADGHKQRIATPCIVTLGSFGRLAPLGDESTRRQASKPRYKSPA